MKKLFTLVAVAMMAVCASAQAVTDYEIDWSTQSSYNMWKGGAGTAEIKDGALCVTNDAVQPNFWDLQLHVANDITLDAGTTYDVKIEMKAVGEGTANVRYKLGNWDNGITGSINVPTGGDFVEYTFSGDALTGSGSFLLVQFGDFVGSVYFKKITISHVPAPSNADWMLKVDLSAAQANAWDSQVLVKLPEALKSGSQYEIFFDVKGSVASTEELGSLVEDMNSSNQDQWGNSADLQYTNNFPVTEEWATVTCGTTDGNFPYNRMILNIGKYEGTLYFDNFKFVEKNGDHVVTVDFNDGITAASKRSWHNHVSLSKVENDNKTTTGVSNIESTPMTNVMYNVAGQRVNDNAKGLIIVNGKKYFNK